MSEGEAIRYMNMLRELIRDQLPIPEALIKEIKNKYKAADSNVKEFFTDMVSNRVPSFNLKQIVE